MMPRITVKGITTASFASDPDLELDPIGNSNSNSPVVSPYAFPLEQLLINEKAALPLEPCIS